MQRCSERIGTIAAALAKAQAELVKDVHHAFLLKFNWLWKNALSGSNITHYNPRLLISRQYSIAYLSVSLPVFSRIVCAAGPCAN